LQVGAVGILFKHIQEILFRRVPLVHLCVAYTGIDGQRLRGLLGNQVDDCSGGTAAVQGACCPFYNLYAVEGVQIETLVIEVSGHVAGHAFAVHEKHDVPGIQTLHRHFAAETYFLYVQSRCLLLQHLLDVSVAGIHHSPAADNLRLYGRQFYRTCRMRTGHDYFTDFFGICFHIECRRKLALFDYSGQGQEA